MNTWLNKKEEILNVELPEKSKSYCPIPHNIFLEEIGEELDKKGYKIAEERYLTGDKGKILTGNFRIQSEEDLEMMPAISFVNSYNKKRKAEIRSSGLVLVCKNGMIGTSQHGSYTRKHSGNALEDFRKHISLVVDGLEKEFRKLLINKEEMKAIELDKRTRALLVGDMIVNEQMITPTQLNIFSREMTSSKDFNDGTLWSFYNNITQSLHESHPYNHDRDHIRFHTYIAGQYNLTGNNGLYTSILN